MADLEILKRLKDIPFKIQTASLKERRAVFKEIQDVLSTPGITEPAVRFVCRVLASTLHRYRDSTSQSYVKGLLAYLAAHHREWVLRNLLPVLQDISDQLKNTATSQSICQSGLYALRWSTVLVEGALKSEENGVDYTALALSQANLLAVVTAYGDTRCNDRAFSMLYSSWKTIGKEKLSKWVEVLLAQPADAGPHVCVAFSALCRHARQCDTVPSIAQHKAKMLESFTKSLISVKTRPNSNYIRGCAELLRLLDRSEVHEGLLPALQKAMLRSPETVIQAVGEVLANLEIDLDGAAVDIGKSLIVNLHSKDEWVRGEALAALRRLARRRAAAAAALALLAHAFAEYNGASGKLTSSEDKIAVLNGVSTLSTLAVSEADKTALFNSMLSGMSRVLESESHERTLCAALDVLRAWCARRQGALPDSILDIFKKNMSAKSTTQAVRVAYTTLVADSLRACRASPAQSEALQPLLTKAVEKAAQQPLQPLVVSEGIAAVLGLVLLDGGRSPRCALAHADRHVLLHDRVLAAAPADVLIQVVTLCSTVLEKYSIVREDQNSPVYRAFILVLLSPAKAVRSAALEQVKQLLAKEDKAAVARNLVLKLNEVLEEGKIFTSKEKTPTEDKEPDVTGKMILDCVQALCSFKDYPQPEAESLAIDILAPCHHPLVVSMNKVAWARACARMRLEPHKLVGARAHELIAKFVDGYTPNETTSNVVSTLVKTNADAVAPSALQAALDALQEPALVRVTRDEYFTYLMPEGELYDKSSIPGNEDCKEMNLKRESKAYSYKEQLEELQLRRELEEKKRKAGKVKEVPLSAKQKEAIKAQLTKESAIRERLSVLNARVVVAVELLSCVQRGSVLALSTRARFIVTALLGALRSPLAAPRALPAYTALRRALLPRHPILGASVATLTVRLHKPQCDLDPTWEEEDLVKGTVRVIHQMHSATAGVRLPTDEDAPPVLNYFTAPGFCYVFPLLKQGMSLSAVRADEGTMLAGLGVVAHHAALRGRAEPLLQPALFPIDHMFRLLIDLISSSAGRVQTACTAALLEAARCAARGGVGAGDVACLLAGLQNPLEVVRDAALRALLCVAECLPPMLEDPEYALQLTKRLLIATFDVADDNKALAQELWNKLPLAQQWSREPELVELVLADVQHPAEPVQRAAALTLASLVEQSGAADAVLLRLQDLYREKLPLIPAKLDQFGHETEPALDEWGARRGAGGALRALAPRLGARAVPAAITFFVHTALADRHEAVRAAMLDAAMTVVDLHGKPSAKAVVMEISAPSATLAVFVLAVTVYYYLTKSWDYWKKRGVVGPKPLWFFGNLKDVALRRTTVCELYEELHNAFPKEKLIGIFRYWRPAILVRDLDLLQHVFVRDFDNFYDRGFSFGKSGSGKNLFHTDGDTWRVLRSRFSPIFSSGKMKNMFPLIKERGETFMDYVKSVLDKSPVINVYPLLQKFTMSTISAYALGVDLDFYKSESDTTLAKLDKLIFDTNFKAELDIALPGLLKVINKSSFSDEVINFFDDIVKRIVKERKGVPSSRKDFMDLLTELHNAGEVHGKKFENEKERVLKVDDELIAAQAFVFYAAGYETSATTLGFMLYELSRHQEVQDRVVREINEAFAQNGGELTYDCLKDLKYLKQVFDETLRMYPIIDPLIRRSVAKYTFPGTKLTIDKDTRVLVSARGVHYDPKIWPEPHKFNPDRFAPENSKDRHPCAYMPFGLGPRNCIGMRFAVFQSRVGAVKLLTKYRVLPPDQIETIKYNPYRALLGSLHGIPLKLVPRN